MLPESFSEPPDLPTSVLCFTLFTGHLLSIGSNAKCHCVVLKSSLMMKTDQAPIYLSDLPHLYTPSWQLHSFADNRVIRISSFHTKSSGHCSFSYQPQTSTNQHPVSVDHATSISSPNLPQTLSLFSDLFFSSFAQ